MNHDLENKANRGLERFKQDGGKDDFLSGLDDKIDGLVDDQPIPQSSSLKGSTKPKKWILSALILLALCVLGYFGYMASSKVDQKRQEPDILFAQNFEVLPATKGGAVRSIESVDLISEENQAFENYQKGNYKSALSVLKTSNTAEGKIYAGISSLSLNDAGKAISLLESAKGLKDADKFEDIRIWYLALAHLKNENIKQAKEIFEQISSNNQYKSKQAEEILSKLH